MDDGERQFVVFANMATQILNCCEDASRGVRRGDKIGDRKSCDVASNLSFCRELKCVAKAILGDRSPKWLC